MIPEKWLRLQLRRQMRKGHLSGAGLDPRPTEGVSQSVEEGERVLASVAGKTGDHYWFTDRRLLKETPQGVSTLLRYEAVEHVHWMFRDLDEWLRRTMRHPDPQGTIARTKSARYDRLLVELKGADGVLTLEGLGQAYPLIFEFLKVLTRART
jgi:hypothetical protein